METNENSLFPNVANKASEKPGVQQEKPEDAINNGNHAETIQDGKQQVAVTIPIILLHYLFKNEKGNDKGTKMTKAQALYDLISKQQIAELTLDTSPVERSVKQLARDWNWNRKAVENFIDTLIEQKVARSFSISGKTHVLLNNITGLPENIREILKLNKTDTLPVPSRPDASKRPPSASIPSGVNNATLDHS